MNTQHQTRYLKELEAANRLIRECDALRTESDGFSWIDAEKVPTEFLEYYRGLVSAGYANGFI